MEGVFPPLKPFPSSETQDLTWVASTQGSVLYVRDESIDNEESSPEVLAKQCLCS